MPRACVVCGTMFTPSRSYHVARFCSKSCVWKATKGPEFNARIARENADKIGDTQRYRGEGRTYIKFRGRHMHRVVAEKKIGRLLMPGEIVHHIDGNFRNNDPENLQIMTQSEHMKLHAPRRRNY